MITQGRFSPQEFVDYIWQEYPELATKRNVTKGTPGKYYPEEGTYTADNSKSIRDLGLKYKDLRTMMKDTFERFQEMEKTVA